MAYQLGVDSDKAAATAFVPDTDVLFIASGHLAAVLALGSISDQHGRIEGIAVPKEYWGWEPFAAVFAPDRYLFDLRHFSASLGC